MTESPDGGWGSRANIALLACVLLGLAFSSLLYGEYEAGGLVCAGGSGCDLVRASAYSSFFGVSVPLLGIVFFVALLATATMGALRPVLLPLASIGAVVGILFFGLQAAVIGAFCTLCLVVDASAVGAGVAAWMSRDEAAPVFNPARAATLAALIVVSLSMALVSPAFAPASGPVAGTAPAPMPGEVAREQKMEGPVTVVEFIDFECPACRMQHQVFEQAFQEFGQEVRMVYMHSPLSMHANADHAARIYICVEETDAAKPMRDFLFTTPDLSLPTVEAHAQEIGVDLEELRACMQSETTNARLARDLDLAGKAGVRSLPTFWIGRQKFIGVSDAATVRKELERWSRP